MEDKREDVQDTNVPEVLPEVHSRGGRRIVEKTLRKKNRPSGLIYKIKTKNKSWFKKGQSSWNKGIPWSKEVKEKMSRNRKGRHNSPQTEFKKSQFIGDKNINWKGDKVGYDALHRWVNRTLGKPVKCEFCSSNKRLVWASKSREYKRRKDDWISLCRRCHGKYDKAQGGKIKEKFGRFYG